MKKQLLVLGAMGLTLAAAWAAQSTDPVLMNVAGKNVHLSEFEYLYHKNMSQQVQPQSLDEYVNMFVDYKLKVADAEAAGIDTTQAFLTEFNQFRNELAAPYMVDTAVQNRLLRQAYEHMSYELLVSHIMLFDGNEAKLDSIRTAIIEGKTTFEAAAAENSIDKPSAARGGLMGTVLPGRYPWPFEEAAYATAEGQISKVINSGYGLHIIRVEKRQPARGEVLVEHILRTTGGLSDSAALAQKVLIDSIYTVASADPSKFAELAGSLSQDPGSAARGGALGWIGPGLTVAEFDSVAFALPVGAVSKPFMTRFGWHIVHKSDARTIGSFEDNIEKLKTAISGDARSSEASNAFTTRMMQQYKAKLITKNFDKLRSLIEKTDAVYDSAFVAEFGSSNLQLVEVAGKKFTLGEVVTSAPFAALRGVDNIMEYIEQSAGRLMAAKSLEQAQEDLALTNVDYRNLVNEYRDGILLFEISNRNVWKRAAEDKAGLEEFFRNNRDKYSWDTPRFKSFVIFAANDSILGEAVAYASTIPTDIEPTEFVKLMRDKFNRDVKVERVIAAKGENAITDFLAFGGEKPSTSNARWASYAAFRGRVIDQPEEAADIRGAIVADYQAELERQWLDSLRSRYKVKINNKVLEQVR